MDRLADSANRHIGKSNNAIENRPGIKGGTHGRLNGIDVEIDGAAILVSIRHLNPYRIAAHRQVGTKICSNSALGNVQHGLYNAVHRNLHDTVTGGHFILQG